MNEKILNGKLLTWTDKIFKQINIIEGTKKHNGNKTRFYTGKYFKEPKEQKIILFELYKAYCISIGRTRCFMAAATLV